MTPDLLKHFKTKKRSVQTVSELKALSEEDRSSLLRSLEPEQIKEVMTAARKYPIVKLPKVKFVVIGEPAIIPSALVTLIVHIKLVDTVDEKVEPLAGDKEEEEEEVQNNKEWWVNNENQTPSVHAPHFPGVKKPVWWVIMGDMRTNRVVTLQKVPDLVKEKRIYLKFAAPPEKGSWDFQVFVKSDSYIGCDVMEEIKLVVQPPEAAPLPDVDDDISEPEDDSIAGQMEVLRKQKSGAGAAPGKKMKKKVTPKPKVNKPPKTYADAEDSSDSEDEIGAEGGPPKHDHQDHSHDEDSLDLSDNEGFIE
jgi:translocation protein SEC63